MAKQQLMEDWECGDCGHTDEAPFDEAAGRSIEKTVGETGTRRESVIETVVCPECYSENWHSKSVRDAFGGIA